MNPTLFLHIGTNKAGSSAIQEFLAGNEPRLNSLGCLYPRTGRIANAHYRISGSLKIGVNPPQDGRILTATEIENALTEEIEQSNCDRVVISSEYFILCRNPGKVKRFFSDFKVRVIVYLRRHDRWLESLYNQGVKTSPVDPKWGDSIESFIDYVTEKRHQEFDFWKLLQPWAKAFGAANILVRPFEPEQLTGGDIRSDCLATIGIDDTAGFEIPSHSTNPSLDHDTIHILDRIARLDIPEQNRKELFAWFVSHQLVRSGTANKRFPLLSPAQRRTLIHRYEPCYKKVAKTFLKRADGRLFLTPPPDDAEPWQPYTGPDTDAALHYSNVVISRLIDELRLLRERVSALERQFTPKRTESSN